MIGVEWLPLGVFVILYAICLASVGTRTFAKGHTWLGVCGIVLPVLWVLGAVLPARPRTDVRPVRRRFQAIGGPTRGSPAPRLNGGARRPTGRPPGDDSGDGVISTQEPALLDSERRRPAAIYRGPNGRRPVHRQQAVPVARPLTGRMVRPSRGGQGDDRTN
jgi:hypothetical protein